MANVCIKSRKGVTPNLPAAASEYAGTRRVQGMVLDCQPGNDVLLRSGIMGTRGNRMGGLFADYRSIFPAAFRSGYLLCFILVSATFCLTPLFALPVWLYFAGMALAQISIHQLYKFLSMTQHTGNILQGWLKSAGLNHVQAAEAHPQLGSNANIGSHVKSATSSTATIQKFADALGFEWEIVFWPKGTPRPFSPVEMSDAQSDLILDEAFGEEVENG